MRAKDPKAYDPTDTMRHSAAHLLAAAVMRIFPDAKLGVGPVVDGGFYYDMALPRQLTEQDLRKLEKTMKKIRQEGHDFRREEMSLDDAIVFFGERGQDFKVELLRDLKEKGTTNLKDEDAQDVDAEKPDIASVYWTGDFVDLCRGPHVENTKDIGAFKLTTIAGAYWRGKEENPQLQRVYGLSFQTEEELEHHLEMLEEAKARDHRRLGKDLDLFSIVDEVGPGLPMFYPDGEMLRRRIEGFVQELQESRGYEAIWIPHITKGRLYEISGHLQKFDAMYPPMTLEGEADYYLKPMNCPHFMMLYRTRPHSYRELPIRWTSTTTNYRYEKSGELSGLTRVRALTQDDCHVFCLPEQVEGEISVMLDMIGEAYDVFGFEDFWVRISTRDPNAPEQYIGDAQVWERSEASLSKLIKARGWTHEVGEGEAAFYGPKLDFMAKDVLGREWQLSTIQLDMNLPERFELEYVADDGSKKRPVVIHRAILGSTERFLGILIEHFAGAFPVWLAPRQVALLSVAERHTEACMRLRDRLRDRGIRVLLDDSNESVGKKIRNTVKKKVPYMLVIGDKEAPESGEWADDTILAVRPRGSEETEEIPLGDFIARIEKEVRERSR